MDAAGPKQVVADGYDAAADDFARWSAGVADPVLDRLFDRFSALLPPGAAVLDVGCGSGIPWTARLAERCGHVVGVDISPVQAARARANVPAAEIHTGDVMALESPGAAFDGITALYATGHLPVADQGPFIERCAAWLRPGGLLLASFPAVQDDGWTGDWLGVPMFFAGLGSAASLRLFDDARWELLSAEEALVREPDGDARFLWVLARVARRPRGARSRGGDAPTRASWL